MEGRFRLPGWRHRSEAIIGWGGFGLAAGSSQRASVPITSYGLRLLRLGRGKLRLLAVVSLHGGFGASGKLVLRRH